MHRHIRVQFPRQTNLRPKEINVSISPSGKENTNIRNIEGGNTLKITRSIAGIALASASLAAFVSAADAKTMKMTTVAAAPPIVTYVKVVKTRIIPEIDKRWRKTSPRSVWC